MAAVRRLSLLLVLAALLSACGGGSSQPAASAPAPARDLSAVRSRTVGAGTAHFTLAIAARVAGAAVRSNETGSISFAKRQAHLYKLLPGGGLPQELILDGPYTYTNANVDAALHDPTVRPWTKLDIRRLPAAQRNRPDELEHVRALAYLVGGVRRARRIGTATVDGAPTTHYRGRVDPDRVVAGTPAAERDGVRTAVRSDFLGTPFAADFWVDGKGRVRRVVVAYRTPNGGRIEVDGTYSQFGEKVDLDLPPARSIQEISP